MREHRDETLDPYEPSDPGYDWDYGEGGPAEHHPPTILWGRIAVLAALVLIAFLVGRLTAGGGGVDQEDFNRVREERDAARDQVEALDAQVTDLENQIAELEEGTTPPDTGDETDEETDQPAEEFPHETYVVKANDTLRGISEQFYEDPELYDAIVSCNPNDVDPETLVVRAGAELIVPDDSDYRCT